MYLFTSACPKVASSFPWQWCLYERSESQLLNGTKCCYIAATSTALACAVPRVYSVFQIQHIAGLQTCRFIKRPIRRLFSLKQGPSKRWFIYLTVSWFYQWLEEAGAHFLPSFPLSPPKNSSIFSVCTRATLGFPSVCRLFMFRSSGPVHHTPVNRDSSAVLPRQGAGPTFPSAVASKG